MGQRLLPDQMQLYRRVDEVLHYLWDPIGVREVSEARDEYHGYLPMVFKLTLEAKDPESISDYLLRIEYERMGFDITSEAKAKATDIANILIRHRDWTHQNKPNK